MAKVNKVLNRFNKRSDGRIYTIAFKKPPYALLDNSLYSVIEAGSDLHQRHFAICDNTGDNISKLNPIYSEHTATYWLWKNMDTDFRFIGQMQYSKWLKYPETTDFNAIFQDYNVILPTPLKWEDWTLEIQWKYWHMPVFFDTATEIINEKFSEYSDAWRDYVINGHEIYYGAGFIMPVKTFDKYCSFVFGVCDEMLERFGGMEAIHDIIKKAIADGSFVDKLAGREGFYQGLVFGFLFERLATAFFKKLGKIKEIDYTIKEHV
ncbi:MAG: DUF4422 domain-containing protein [Alphaproteobacteria bacterium]|nr:DUF4422 domain-containing protein [Alphaproteobacteria bacterium]